MNEVNFQELTNPLQLKLNNILLIRFTYRGDSNPKLSVEKFVSSKSPKCRKQWRNIVWQSMCSIDKKRKELGLSALYS